MAIIDPKLLRLLCYEASDGLRLMIFGPMQVDLLALHTTFLTLSREKRSLQLHAMSYVHSHDVQLHLQSYDDDAIGSDIDSLKLTGENPFAFQWCQTFQEWEYCCELLAALIESPSPSHQYLTNSLKNDATIVVSVGEYPDSLIGG